MLIAPSKSTLSSRYVIVFNSQSQPLSTMSSQAFVFSLRLYLHLHEMSFHNLGIESEGREDLEES